MNSTLGTVCLRPAAALCTLIAALSCTAGVLAAQGERYFVKPNGTRIPLVKSTTELAVTLRGGADADSCKHRLASMGCGVLTEVNPKRPASIKILKVADTKAARRQRARLDPDITSVRSVYRMNGTGARLISSGTIAVKLRPELTSDQRVAFFADYQLDVIEEMDGLHDVYVVAPVHPQSDEVLRAESMASDPRVRWAQPNFITSTHVHQAVPQDTLYFQQWHLNNTGQMGGVADADIDAPEAWLLSEGADIVIGIFDDAVDVTHPDLRQAFTGSGQDVTLEFNDPGYEIATPKALNDRHGTAVLGLALARANSIGVRGVSYLSNFTASRGIGELLTASQVASAFTFARQENVDVHINSWGRGTDSDSAANEALIVDALETAFRDGRIIQGTARGIVILFSSGNGGADGIGDLNDPDFELSAEPWVIGVGASTVEDKLASYSNWGQNIDILAPSGDDFLAALTTTDIEDAAGYPELGYNIGGVDEDGFPEADGLGNYTQNFGGTSASCPIVAGVAALVLSKNPLLTATDVRMILLHTTDKIDPEDAQYGRVTNRSTKYGYGRVNAEAAVIASGQSLTNGNRSWPERPSVVRIADTTVRWGDNFGIDEYLVVESDAPFDFVPFDGGCYDCDQVGCSSGGSCDEDDLDPLPNGVSLLSAGIDESADFLLPAGEKYFALYGRSTTGRYSFGVDIDSNGNPWDEGSSTVPGSSEPGEGGGGSGGDPVTTPQVNVTISVAPRQGTSPLTVHFAGNAISDLAIDNSRTEWDFDTSDGENVPPDAIERSTTHVYEAAPGTVEEFTARLTMYDVEGNTGYAQVIIVVDGGDAPTVADGQGDLRILISVPGTVGSDVESGTAPFDVLLSVEATGTLQGTLQSVFWGLGDGGTATSLAAPHTYQNNTANSITYGITATVTLATSPTTWETRVVSRQLVVFPAIVGNVGGNVNLNGAGVPPSTGTGGGLPCAFGFFPVWFCLGSLWLIRLRRSGRTVA